MPTISTFEGIVIYMYWAEHGVPHLHAKHDQQIAVFSIATGEIIVGTLRRRARRLVSRWIVEQRQALLENWHRARDGLPMTQLPGPNP